MPPSGLDAPRPSHAPAPAPTLPADLLAAAPGVRALATALANSTNNTNGHTRRVIATGSAGSSSALIAACVARIISRPLLLVVAHIDEADEIAAELESAGDPVFIQLPALEALPGETGLSAELLAARLTAAKRAAQCPGDRPALVIAPIAALMQALPPVEALAGLTRALRPGDTSGPRALIDWLGGAGYRRVDAVEEPGDFAVRGGIVDVFPAGGSVTIARDGAELTADAAPVRLDYFGDELERISEIDLETMGSDRALCGVEIVTASEHAAAARDGGVSFIDLLPRGSVGVIAETMEVIEQGRGYFERATDGRGLFGPPAVIQKLQSRLAALAELNQFSAGQAQGDARVELQVEPLPAFENEASASELAALDSPSVLVACQNQGERARLDELIDHAAPQLGENAAKIRPIDAYVHRGFISREPGATFALVPYHEFVNRFEVRRRTGGVRSGRAMDTFIDLAVGDFVVHQDHGIARFVGLEVMPAGTAARREGSIAADRRLQRASGGDSTNEEFLTLEFAGSTRLHVPAAQIDLVQKYVGGFSGKPPLSTMGGTRWKNAKARVEGSVRDLAAEMLRVRAAREHMPGIAYPADTAWQREFEAAFPYNETEDQLAALSEIKRDMSGPRPMDRLICGDVGFGKTELAIRAAFKACEFGKQVAVLVPTTVLAEQHERTFRARFADYPFRVESLSRFKSAQEINATLAAVRRGEVDVVVGTHRLLSKDVRFADLGLVVVDEEQRFGVEHKERLLQLRMTVDVLTLSATPIPRTLHMAMLGLRDISSLTTPPLDRRAIVTEVIPFNENRVRRAIERELARDGQCYFIHNRVQSIDAWADRIRNIAPGARVVVGHGQMDPKDLEKVMLAFMRRQADVLVATTIIESGIDIASANTMFINEADRHGLADLHQLRGRVGRSRHRAYCYLLLPPDRAVKELAQRRLKAIERYAMLGAGFKIAMRDLEIRGAGNLLGAEQSGHIAAVGYELFCRMLEEAVRQMRHEPERQQASRVSIDIGVHGLLPRAYIPSDPRRLEAYRRLAIAPDDPAIDSAERDLISAYGDPPKSAQRLIELARLRARASALGVRAIARRGRDVVLSAVDPAPVADALRSGPGDVRVVAQDLAQSATRGLGGERTAEVYLRLSDAALEPQSLLTLLAHRLRPKPTLPSLHATHPPIPQIKPNPDERPQRVPGPPRSHGYMKKP